MAIELGAGEARVGQLLDLVVDGAAVVGLAPGGRPNGVDGGPNGSLHRPERRVSQWGRCGGMAAASTVRYPGTPGIGGGVRMAAVAHRGSGGGVGCCRRHRGEDGPILCDGRPCPPNWPTLFGSREPEPDGPEPHQGAGPARRIQLELS